MTNFPSIVMVVVVVSYSYSDTKTLPNPVIGPEATEAVLPVPPIPPPACGLGPHDANNRKSARGARIFWPALSS